MPDLGGRGCNRGRDLLGQMGHGVFQGLTERNPGA